MIIRLTEYGHVNATNGPVYINTDHIERIKRCHRSAIPKEGVEEENFTEIVFDSARSVMVFETPDEILKQINLEESSNWMREFACKEIQRFSGLNGRTPDLNGVNS